jgi:hypothetical protein
MRPEPRDDKGGQEGGDLPSEEDDRRRITEDLTAATLGIDARQVPEALCRACVRLLPISGASVSISASQALHAVWCASDSTAAPAGRGTVHARRRAVPE